jgi:AraC-like DNA-binding protein
VAGLNEWESKITGLTRSPTTGLQAVLAEKAGFELDPVDRFIRQRRFEREMFRLARRHLTECYMVPTREWGAGILTSSTPGVSDFERRSELKTLTSAISKHFRENMKTAILIGVGEPVALGESPVPSLGQAFLALQEACQKGSSPVFYGDLGDVTAQEPGMDPYRLADSILDMLRKSDSVGIEGAVDQYVRATWNHSALSVHEHKIHYRYLEMATAHVLGFAFPKAFRVLQALLHQGLREIDLEETSEGLSHVFRQWLNRARQSASKPSWGSQSATLEMFVRDLERTLREPWTLERAAKSLGMSRAPFARKFKALMGVSFHRYLLRLRIHEAMKLLRKGNLPGANVAQECGFKSGSHFTQAFRKEVGKSPIRWRQGALRTE